MDELSLIVEGISNKVKKLLVRNKQLKEKVFHLETEKLELQARLREEQTLIKQLENRLAEVQVAKALNADDSLNARQKVNELLREIEKCYSLLNR